MNIFLSVVLIVGVGVSIVTPQFSFIPSQSYYQLDPLLSSQSIQSSSFVPSQSFNSFNSFNSLNSPSFMQQSRPQSFMQQLQPQNYVQNQQPQNFVQQPQPVFRNVQQQPQQPANNGINSLFERVIEEATTFVDNGELPLPVNGTIQMSHHHHSGPTSANAHGSHNYHHGGHHGTHGMSGRNYCKFTPKSHKIGRVSNIHIRAYEILTKQYQVPKSQALSYLKNRLPVECTREQRPLYCDGNSRYRTYDGTCNNLENPYWGASYTQFDRLAPSVYEDGWNEPRGAGFHLQGARLPNARIVSLSVHPDYVQPDNRMTNMVPQFGQFLDHDMTLTPEADRRCCSRDANNVDCFNIRIPSDDYFFSKLNSPQTCMDFTRSTPFCFPNQAGQREQMNIVTAFVDASHVYASETNRTRLLRAFQGGRLRVNQQHSGFLPTVAEIQAETGEHFEFMGSFYGGEERVNEMPGLTVMHTLLFREHNRIADQIAERRPYWDDETIFQEARRIMIAEWQNSVYGEYLPIILGNATMRRYNLDFNDRSTLSTQYNPTLNPNIFHAFADAAYRFGHTLINGLIRMMKGFQDVNRYRIRDNFFNHEQISYNGGEGYDLILGGLMAQNSQTYDTFITEDVTNFLLKERTRDFGGDLIARNLQRAREHGLPSYNVYRSICGLPGMSNSWENRPQNIPENVWNVLGSLYETPVDIDLFSGGLAEVPVPEAVTGHTFNCLKALQFARAKFGDRFYFTHQNQPGSFTEEQMREIRKRTFGDIICQNSVVEMTTRNVFKMPSENNPMIPCNDPSRNSLNIEIFLYNRQ